MTAGRWVVRLVWGVGWLLAQQAADRSVMIGSTEETVGAYEQSLPYGLAGAGLMLAAAVGRFAYRGPLSASWFAGLAVVSLALFLGRATGEPLFWQLLCLVAAVGQLAGSEVRERTSRAAPHSPARSGRADGRAR